MSRILVIKLGALGDFIQALGPFAAIRRHHAGDEITLVTTIPYVPIAQASGLFDHVTTVARLPWWRVDAWLGLRAWLRGQGFQRVYDLQTSDRSSAMFHLMKENGGPEWSGIAQGCSHPHANPRRDFLHTVDRQREQLQMAGIAEVPASDLTFLTADLTRFAAPDRYALLVPGGSARRQEKRWPGAAYAALARTLMKQNIQPMYLGGRDEARLVDKIRADAGGGRSLAGRTSLAEIAALARGAMLAVGNDTGPMHVIAAAGCPSTVLFSSASDPALCAPRGPAVTVIRRERLADLPAAEVAATLPMR